MHPARADIMADAVLFAAILDVDGAIVASSPLSPEARPEPGLSDSKVAPGRIAADSLWREDDWNERGRFAAALALSRRDGPTQITTQVRDAAGQFVDAWLVLAPLSSDPVRVLCVVARSDNDEALHQARRTLEESRARLEMACDAGAIGIHDFNPLTGELFWDARCRAIWGLGEHDPVSAETFWSSIAAGDREMVEARVADAVDPSKGGRYVAEFRVWPWDGSPMRWVRATGMVFFEGEGDQRRAIRLVGTATDITAKKADETALVEAQRTVQMALHATGGLVYDWDLARGDVRRSEGLDALLGWKVGEVPTSSGWWAEQMHPDDRAQAHAKFERAEASGADYLDTEYRLRHRDGRYVWVWDHARLLRDAKGRVRRFVGCTFNIDARRRAEEALRASEAALARHRDDLEAIVRERTEQLEETHRRLRLNDRLASVGTLAAGLGHDLSNLLMIMRMRLDSLSAFAAGSDNESAKEDARELSETLVYLVRLARGLQLFATDPDRASSTSGTDVAAWMDDVEAFFKMVLPRRTAFVRSIDASLPRVALAAAPLTQCVYNLVQNAGDALRGRDGARIEIAARMDGGMVAVSVTDNGPGMSPETARRCMEPFYSTKQHGKGSGFGLALISSIATAAGGELCLTTSPGEGTRFTLRLPTATRNVPAAPVVVRAGAAEASLMAPSAGPRGDDQANYR
jgi:PAS domain S-box-containing protein